MCSTHDWNAKSQDKMETAVFTSVSRVRPSREIPAKQFVLLFCPICSTTSSPTLYIPSLPTDVEKCFWEKTLATILYTITCGFSSTPTSPFSYHWEVDNSNTYHTLSEYSVRFWCCWEALKEAKLWWIQSGVLWDPKS